MQVQPRKLISYKDICAGINGNDYEEEDKDDYIDNSGTDVDDEVDDVEGDDEDMDDSVQQDPLCPVIKVTKQELKEACKPWRKAIIVKLLGKKLGLSLLRLRLERLWQPMGEMEVIELDHEFYIIRFSNMADYAHVFNGGPWVIMGHYLIIQQWQPGFVPEEGVPGKVAVWVRIPKFPVELYGKHFLWRIGNHLGRMLRIDDHTLKVAKDGGQSIVGTERCKFARICVEVDLRKALVAKFNMNEQVYKVEYEGLNMICFHCGRFGHRKESCPLSTLPKGVEAAQGNGPEAQPQSPAAAEESQPFGDWMIVKREKRKGGFTAKSKGGSFNAVSVPNLNLSGGSRFNALQNQGETSNSKRTDFLEGNVEVIAINEDSTKGADHVANHGAIIVENNGLQVQNNKKNIPSGVGPKIIAPSLIAPNNLEEVTAPAHSMDTCDKAKHVAIVVDKNNTRAIHQESANSVSSQKRKARAKGSSNGAPTNKDSKSNSPGGVRPVILQGILNKEKAENKSLKFASRDSDDVVPRERDRSLSPGSTKRSA